MKRVSRLIKGTAAVFLTAALAVMAIVGFYSHSLPDSYYLTEGMSAGYSRLGCLLDVRLYRSEDSVLASANGDSLCSGELKLWGTVPIKDAELKSAKAPSLIPGGSPIGIKFLTDGVMVVKLQEVLEGVCPAKDAGLVAGDNIVSANGERLSSSARLSQIISESGGEPIALTVQRGRDSYETSLVPVQSQADGSFKGGILIRDSSAGVGTLTYIDPKTGCYGALGHQISDCDTQRTLPLGSGEIVDVTVTGYERGERGCPGELFGTFVSGLAAGSVTKNCEQGVFGVMTYPPHGEAVPIAFRQEVCEGKASILTTISGNTPKEYEVEIERISLSDGLGTKNLVIRVTDPELLSQTGGIVQGMSGSPILQNGKLVGAVTHVFLSDPSRGYGIFIENMLEAAG